MSKSRDLAKVLVVGTLGACVVLTADVRAQKAAKVPRTQEAAGSAHVAVLSVAPWDEYVTALQPNFPMDEERALKEAIPDTLLAERRLADVLNAGLKIALPSSTKTSSTEETNKKSSTSKTEDEKTTATGERSSSSTDSTKRQTTPGDVSKVTTGELDEAGSPSKPKTSPLDGTVGVDPFLRYGAAASLFQEVRLLQRYVRDALVAQGQDAYVIRLQVTLMPAQRRLPLDAYTTLSVFDVMKKQTPVTIDRPTWEKLVGTSGAGRSQAQTRTLEELTLAVPQISEAKVRVVPLLVTDNLEGALESNSTATLRSFAFGLLGMLSNAGLSGDVSRSIEKLQSFVGRDFNSLLTVGQVTDNTIRVRFGARNQGDDSVGMVPRNQTVTLLVVRSKPASGTQANQLRVFSKTDFVNATTGEFMSDPSRFGFQDHIDKALHKYDLDITEKDPAVAAMVDAAQRGDIEAFQTTARLLDLKGNGEAAAKLARLNQFMPSIWLDVVALLAKLPYSMTSVDLPPARTVEFPTLDKSARLLASDDGKETAVRVVGARNLQGEELWATLKFNDVVLPAVSLTFGALGDLVVKFPSAKAMSVCRDDDESDCEAVGGVLALRRLAQRWETKKEKEDPPRDWSIAVAYRQTKVPDDAPKAGFTAVIGSKVIVATGTTGRLRIDLTKKKDAAPKSKVVLKVDGAMVLKVLNTDTNTELKPKEGAYEITDSAVLMIELDNLFSTVPVHVSLAGIDKPDTLDLVVVPAPDKK